MLSVVSPEQREAWRRVNVKPLEHDIFFEKFELHFNQLKIYERFRKRQFGFPSSGLRLFF